LCCWTHFLISHLTNGFFLFNGFFQITPGSLCFFQFLGVGLTHHRILFCALSTSGLCLRPLPGLSFLLEQTNIRNTKTYANNGSPRGESPRNCQVGRASRLSLSNRPSSQSFHFHVIRVPERQDISNSLSHLTKQFPLLTDRALYFPSL